MIARSGLLIQLVVSLLVLGLALITTNNAEGELEIVSIEHYNSKIDNPEDDREGFNLYTQNNTTGDFVADTLSNYIKIYKTNPNCTYHLPRPFIYFMSISKFKIHKIFKEYCYP